MKNVNILQENSYLDDLAVVDSAVIIITLRVVFIFF